MPPKLTPVDLATFLVENPHVITARFTETEAGPLIEATFDTAISHLITSLPGHFLATPIRYAPTQILRDLRLPLAEVGPRSNYTACQDEPVNLGTQIQPQGKNWVGTAGAPVRFPMEDAPDLYGFLTNWHVLPGGDLPWEHPVHQPLQAFPPFARLHDWNKVVPTAINYADAAFADSFIDGFHTTSDSIIGIGLIVPDPLDATPDLVVKKVGRTTGQTNGVCDRTGEAVRVNYGDFQAVFADQDVYRSADGNFSAAGDSGSLIFDYNTERPVSLLFAGGGGLTIGNPIRHVLSYLPIDFVFP